jgi:hypothetical protein
MFDNWYDLLCFFGKCILTFSWKTKRRTLHGRHAFVGQRTVVGAYLARQTLESRVRVLQNTLSK